MAGVPYTFATATTSIPLSQLDANFNTQITIGSSTVGLGNTTTTLAGLSNVSTTTLTVTNDASISGLTVGKGGGSLTNNTAVGANALSATNTGSGLNTAVGVSVLASNTSGQENSAFGVSSLGSNTTGSSNVGIGRSALASNTTASNNTAVGYQAGYNNQTGGVNTFLGRLAGYVSSNSSGNVFLGASAGYTANSNSGANDNNTFVGYASGYYVTTGTKNTIIGGYNGNQGGLDIRTASNYIVLSDGDGVPNAYWDANGTLFQNQTRNGYYAQITYKNYFGNYWYSAALTTTTPDFRIYNQNGAGTYMSWGATSWSGSSDERLKTITSEIDNGLSKVNTLRAVNFTWKSDDTNTAHVGLIAQDVQKVLPEAISEDEEGHLGVRYTEVIPLLVAAIKELNAKVTALEAQLGAK